MEKPFYAVKHKFTRFRRIENSYNGMITGHALNIYENKFNGDIIKNYIKREYA